MEPILECRTCLAKSGKMQPIFRDDSEAIVQKIYDCTGLKLENITGLPPNICEWCNSLLIIAHRFKTGCLAADLRFKNRYYGYEKRSNLKTECQLKEPVLIVETKESDSVDIEASEANKRPAIRTRSQPLKKAKKDKLEIPKEQSLKEDAKKIKSIRVVEGSKVKYKTECPICGVIQQNLRQHLLVHSKVKSFECSFCSKKFSQKGNYNNHLNIHTGNRPYSCKVPTCKKNFSDPNSLKSHMISHTQERNYHCDICEKSFGYSHTLNVHKLSHTQERKHKCTHSQCDKTFMTKYSLTKHLRVHTGEKKFKCKVCSKAFSCSGNLTTHNKVHTKLKPFRCEICNLSFAYKCVLRNHMNIHQREFSAKIS